MSLTRKSRSISYARRGWSVGTMCPQPRSITYEKVFVVDAPPLAAAARALDDDDELTCTCRL